MYNKIIKSKINELGEGYFESYSDITHKDHQISWLNYLILNQTYKNQKFIIVVDKIIDHKKT